jgi:hypothetical protein
MKKLPLPLALSLLVALVAAITACAFIHSTVHAQTHLQARGTTYSLLPSESRGIDLQNANVQKIDIQSQFPVEVFVGTCYNAYTIQYSCTPGSQRLIIHDKRAPAIIRTPQANAVTVRIITAS